MQYRLSKPLTTIYCYYLLLFFVITNNLELYRECVTVGKGLFYVNVCVNIYVYVSMGLIC